MGRLDSTYRPGGNLAIQPCAVLARSGRVIWLPGSGSPLQSQGLNNRATLKAPMSPTSQAQEGMETLAGAL